MKHKLIVLFILLLFSGNLLSQSTEKKFLDAFSSLYNGELMDFSNIITPESREKIQIYFENYNLFKNIHYNYDISLNLKNNKLYLFINKKSFSFNLVISNKTETSKIFIEEENFRSLFWKEKKISYEVGLLLFNLGFEEDSFNWILQSAKEGYSPAQLMIFGGVTTRSFWDNQYKDSIIQVVDIPADNTLSEIFSTKEEQNNYLEYIRLNFLESYNYKLYLDLITEEANKGNTRFMNLLAREFSLFKKNYKNGINLNAYWYEQSAKQGNQDAMYQIGRYYADSLILDLDYEKSFDWFNKLYELNNEHEVILKLIKYYYYGIGVEKNINKALKLLEKAENLALESNNYKIAEGVGHIYYGDIPELQDAKESYKYFKVAGKHLTFKALERLEDVKY